MAKAEICEVLPVSKEALFAAITEYGNYPQFVEGCTHVQVEKMGPGKSKVTYRVSMMKEVNYTLDMSEDFQAGTVNWTLVSSDFFKKNNGAWKLKTVSEGKTEAHYSLEVEFNIPVPGFILNKLVKGGLPSMLKNFERQALKKQ